MGFDEPVFRKTAEEHIDALLASPSPWREGIDRAALEEGRAVRMRPPRGRWHTPSGKIEIRNASAPDPLPRWRPTHEEDGKLPLRLQTAPSLHCLNSSFAEREDLERRLGPPAVQVAPGEAAARGLADGAEVVAWNDVGELECRLRVTADVPPGVAVIEGVHWLWPGGLRRNANALTSQRLTDAGAGSTFYDNRIDLRPA
jgi:anaerobic selenocysteine-containing dehydrogenase